ncbi:aminotransferase class I/II-fold pyridoxal phosphate-dependent enzyme [Lactobacillus helveticus]|uniref:aminotransferase class I/II-fold pyridoxal phosphate-dependent enzyme n=1 Tax=Lactobacillus helveticus TaxID=1587 RepID=UPI001562C098|nr:aminotransferase class I/II-fold pyridoxal phosphate-dependent enzyme [Lactobacillus helveticus]
MIFGRKKDIDICTQTINSDTKNYCPFSPDIVMTTSFKFDSYEDFCKASVDEKNHYVYTRGSNPTTVKLENILAQLDHGEKCKVFASGMGAISATLFSLLKQGDHLLMINTIYGEAASFAQYLHNFGIESDRIDVANTDEIFQHVKENTKIIYFESPSSEKFEMLDLQKIANFAKKHNILTVIDATWASPLFTKPIDFGIDLVIHSLSKYVGGHSDVLGGSVVGSNKLVNQIFEYGHQFLDSTNSPFNSWLAIRGLRTLPLRMQHANQAIKVVLDALKDDDRIKRIYHPYCSENEQKELAQKYLKGYGSLFAFDLNTDDLEKVKIFINSLKTISIGVSWGGYESLALAVYKGNNLSALKKRKLEPTHIRIFVGLEDPNVILDDIKHALDTAFK